MKNIKLIYSENFFSGLKEIVDYISQDNPGAARAVARRINDRIKTLKKFPEMGKLQNDARLQNIRILIVGNYLILYEFKSEDKIIYLHGICQGAVDFQNLFKDL